MAHSQGGSARRERKNQDPVLIQGHRQHMLYEKETNCTMYKMLHVV